MSNLRLIDSLKLYDMLTLAPLSWIHYKLRNDFYKSELKAVICGEGAQRAGPVKVGRGGEDLGN